MIQEIIHNTTVAIAGAIRNGWKEAEYIHPCMGGEIYVCVAPNQRPDIGITDADGEDVECPLIHDALKAELPLWSDVEEEIENCTF